MAVVGDWPEENHVGLEPVDKEGRRAGVSGAKFKAGRRAAKVSFVPWWGERLGRTSDPPQGHATKRWTVPLCSDPRKVDVQQVLLVFIIYSTS